MMFFSYIRNRISLDLQTLFEQFCPENPPKTSWFLTRLSLRSGPKRGTNTMNRTRGLHGVTRVSMEVIVTS